MHYHYHRQCRATALHHARFMLCLTLKMLLASILPTTPARHNQPPHVDTIAWHCPLRDAQPLGEFHLYRVPTRPGKLNNNTLPKDTNTSSLPFRKQIENVAPFTKFRAFDLALRRRGRYNTESLTAGPHAKECQFRMEIFTPQNVFYNIMTVVNFSYCV